MGILDNLAQRLGYTKAGAGFQPPAWLQQTGYAEQFSIPDGALPKNQARLFQALSWVNIAVTMTAQTAAGTPFSVKRLVGEDEKDIPNHPFELLLRRPNPLMSRFELLEAIFSYRQLTGTGYMWMNKRNEFAPPTELWSIPTHKLKPVPDGKLFMRGYLYDPGGDGQYTIPLETWEIVSFRRFHPLNEFVGLSPIEAIATVAEGDLKAQSWNTAFFGENNAKLPGALAFSDPINDADWSRLKGDIQREHGGTKRNLMMLRNVGKGGVEWVSMAMSQKDMEFLAARNFTKEEIFAIFAPGLSSLLAINATEANSTAGKATFIEHAVWPQLTAVAEKITNDVLPSYGDNIIGEFDDIRLSDRAMELAEEAAFAEVHTIDEIRQQKYGDGPLGDDRGKLLIKEVANGLTRTTEPQAPPAFGGNPAAVDEDQEPPEPNETAEPPVPGKAAELKAFRRWLKNRANPDPDDFRSDVLSRADKVAVMGEVGIAQSAFFTLGFYEISDTLQSS